MYVLRRGLANEQLCVSCSPRWRLTHDVMRIKSILKLPVSYLMFVLSSYIFFRIFIFTGEEIYLSLYVLQRSAEEAADYCSQRKGLKEVIPKKR